MACEYCLLPHPYHNDGCPNQPPALYKCTNCDKIIHEDDILQDLAGNDLCYECNQPLEYYDPKVDRD